MLWKVEFKNRQFYCKNKKEKRKAILEQSQNPEGIKLIKKGRGQMDIHLCLLLHVHQVATTCVSIQWRLPTWTMVSYHLGNPWNARCLKVLDFGSKLSNALVIVISNKISPFFKRHITRAYERFKCSPEFSKDWSIMSMLYRLIQDSFTLYSFITQISKYPSFL